MPYWIAAKGRTTVYIQTLAWSSGIATIGVGYGCKTVPSPTKPGHFDFDSDSTAKMLFEFRSHSIAIVGMKPRYGHYDGFPIALSVTGLPSTATDSYIEVYVGAEDNDILNQVTVKKMAWDDIAENVKTPQRCSGSSFGNRRCI